MVTVARPQTLSGVTDGFTQAECDVAGRGGGRKPLARDRVSHCERHVHDIVVGVRSFDEIGVVSEIVPQSNRPLHIYSVISKTSRGRLELSRATRSSRRRLELSRPTRLSRADSGYLERPRCLATAQVGGGHNSVRSGRLGVGPIRDIPRSPPL